MLCYFTFLRIRRPICWYLWSRFCCRPLWVFKLRKCRELDEKWRNNKNTLRLWVFCFVFLFLQNIVLFNFLHNFKERYANKCEIFTLWKCAKMSRIIWVIVNFLFCVFVLIKTFFRILKSYMLITVKSSSYGSVRKCHELYKRLWIFCFVFSFLQNFALCFLSSGFWPRSDVCHVVEHDECLTIFLYQISNYLSHLKLNSNKVLSLTWTYVIHSWREGRNSHNFVVWDVKLCFDRIKNCTKLLSNFAVKTSSS